MTYHSKSEQTHSSTEHVRIRAPTVNENSSIQGPTFIKKLFKITYIPEDSFFCQIQYLEWTQALNLPNKLALAHSLIGLPLLYLSIFYKDSCIFNRDLGLLVKFSVLRFYPVFFSRVHIGSIGLDMLQVVRISQAQGLQRTGRAGRQGEGHCYRMLTKNVSTTVGIRILD